MGFARGSLAFPRMGAHRPVIGAAALTVAVAAALATALASLGGQALPRAVQHDLDTASGTALAITGNVDAGQAAQYTSVLPSQVRSALDGTAFAFYRAAVLVLVAALMLVTQDAGAAPSWRHRNSACQLTGARPGVR
jgi:hypothetical protein